MASGDLADAAGFADAVIALFAAVGRRPTRVTYSDTKAKTRAFKESTFRSLVSGPLRRITAWSKDDEGAPEVVSYLRDNPAHRDIELRWGGGVTPHADRRESISAFAARVEACLPLVSGGLAGYRSRAHAEFECFGTDIEGACDEVTQARLGWDAMRYKRAQTKVRRLYPVTIIGPEIWAQLPPMPAFDPMPKVEDLGDCKLVTAWPTLCEPRDPEFLGGTRALREWLWPYSIQNPADHVDNDP